ncbi:hypothetical protein LTR62_001540 [Meristemomyces frigidus]|uniref:Protein FYV10 n=1 Tax=Meristemomyces frigidus TaxID=1508187 RepID=A0AAN7TSQ6_9PEZI|nr:hypothetical protein LTR62_001540 [Meristemomyces frigidus]
MAEVATSKLDPDSHLLLDQPLLRLPHELLRKNLKTAQRHIESTHKAVSTSIDTLKPAAKPADTLAALEATLAKAQSLKRKLEALHEEEQTLHRQQRARIGHLQDLHDVQTVDDVKFDNWSEVRLDRLLVDYLLRQGYSSSARALSAAKSITDLVDIEVFEEVRHIDSALRRGDVKEALAWCGENKQALKKIGSQLELELRLQQFIALRRTGEMGKLMEAVVHARKHLVGGLDTEFGLKAGGLLAHPPNTMVEPYATMYSPARSSYLATLFLQTHHNLYSLPSQPLLHTALSAGLSALKTPTCHSLHRAQLSSPAIALVGNPVCPICSTELNELARGVPYAHHTKSHMEEDPVVLPNDRVFGRERLKMLNEKLGVPGGRVRDPTEALRGREWSETELRRVYIS